MKKDIGTPDKDTDTEGTDAPALHQSRHAGKLPSPPEAITDEQVSLFLTAVPVVTAPGSLWKKCSLETAQRRRAQNEDEFFKDELAMVYQYAASTKEETLAGLKRNHCRLSVTGRQGDCGEYHPKAGRHPGVRCRLYR